VNQQQQQQKKTAGGGGGQCPLAVRWLGRKETSSLLAFFVFVCNLMVPAPAGHFGFG